MPNQTPLEIAQKAADNAFLLMIAWLIVSGVVGIWLTYRVNKKQNEYQELALADARTRTAEADAKAEQAKKDAATANAQGEATKKETAALNLKVQEESLKRAKAERDLLELRERIKARRLTVIQRQRLMALLD